MPSPHQTSGSTSPAHAHATPSSQFRIGYVPYSADLSNPGDRRRFPAYAKARGIPFEIARPDQDYDVVVLSEVADLGAWLDYRKGKLVFELIDSYLAIPLSDPMQLLRGVAWYAKGRHSRLFLNFPGALERMCRHADAVVCTTEEQQRTIAPFCENIHIVLDMHDDLIKSVKTDYRAGTPVHLVWEGLPSNVYQLGTIASALEELSRRHKIHLDIVTDVDMPHTIPWLGRVKTLDIARRLFDAVTVHPWEAATWSDTITRCDIAVIPIDLGDPLTVGKPGNKLSLLWRAAMPVVTSATPAYLRMQRAAGSGELACQSVSEWVTALDTLIGDESARRTAGEKGHAYATQVMSTSALLNAWDQVLASVGIDVPNLQRKAP